MATRREAITQLVLGTTVAVAGGRIKAAAEPTAAPRAGGGRIKIGQIGVGHAHANKLGVYRRSPDYEVVGIVESDPTLKARAETQAVFQGVPWMTCGLPLDRYASSRLS